MPLFAILLWLAGDRFLLRGFARLSLPLFANVAFAVYFTENLPWCTNGKMQHFCKGQYPVCISHSKTWFEFMD